MGKIIIITLVFFITSCYPEESIIQTTRTFTHNTDSTESFITLTPEQLWLVFHPNEFEENVL